jgi:enamine deaminase RidA (YjgF/YER057c/UK114 family)
MLESSLSHLTLSAMLAGLLLATGLSPSARSEEPKLSISGYDPVAYFTDGKPVQGKSEIEHLWHKLRWRFASSEHREMFAKDPDHYAPQYDGYCAMGVAETGGVAHKDTVDPEAWAIVDGKLYLTHMPQGMDDWRQNPAAFIKQADANWTAVKDLTEPTILGPPCGDSPPSTLVALRGGGHWVVVGPESARDDAGKIVGKGDMGAQLDLIGKKVEACLKVAGARLSDIVATRTYVADPDQLAKYADLRKQYFGHLPERSFKREGFPTRTISSRLWPSLPSNNPAR